MKYNCDFCGKEFNIKPSQLRKNKTSCCSRKCSSELKKIYYKGENNPNYRNSGENNNIFKGYRIKQSGYYMIYVPEHPLSNKNGRIREHRYLAEKYLAKEEHLIEINGIKVLNPIFDVHHKDKNKLNNKLDNLEILTRKEHALIHQGEKHDAKTISKICKYCNKEYEVIKSRSNSKYCSEECMKMDKTSNIKENKCPICGNVFKHNKNQSRKCCSVKCSNIFRNRGLIEFVCDNCGAKSKMKLSRYNKSVKHFCCNECYHESKRK